MVLVTVMDPVSSTNAPEVRAIRKWFFVALVFSLALHGFLYELFQTKKLERFAFSGPTERLVPRPFTVNKVVINEDLLKPEKEPAEPKKPDPQKNILQTADDKPSAEKLPSDIRLTPTAPPGANLAKAMVAEKPRVEPGKVVNPEANAQVEREMDSLRQQIGPKDAPKIVAGAGTALAASKSEGDGKPDFGAIDNALAKTGPFSGTLGIGNGGALFDFDSAKLKATSAGGIRKLGELIQREPRSAVTIEGYTDTFGTPEYNEKLSKARAEAIKAWLVANMKLDPAKIQTKGFGSTHLIVPSGTREQQAPNRRVEIVIRTPKN